MPHFLAIGKDWWLPPNYSVHGRETDALFYWFFWITFVILVIVQILLVGFLLKYRRRAGRRATFIHGNSRVEMIWTAIPAVILAVLALGSKRVWDDYRNSPDLRNPNRTRVMVIAQQYAWTGIYPGPDGKFGRYLIFPKPTDKLWPAVNSNGKRETFEGVIGPAELSPKDALAATSKWIDQDDAHRMGKDFSDPAGDDDVVQTPGAQIEVPANRPVEFLISSKDVIHDFYLPNFRAQLYAVPGMQGSLILTPTTTNAELDKLAPRESVDISTLLAEGSGNRVIDIDGSSPGAENAQGWRYGIGTGRKRKSIVRDGQYFDADAAARLKGAGIDKVKLHTPASFEIVCAQLCGELHSTMRGELVVLPQAEFDQKHPGDAHVPASGSN
jgi:heme/copper-type cytochrome/quinol oxidase subunit 2